MDCDQFFAALTRGPLVPESDEQQEVLEHLDHCDDCRVLAEAFRPAPDLFHESLPRDEENSLPSFRVRNTPVLAPLGGVGQLTEGARSVPPLLYRRAARPPARRTWLAGRRLQSSAPAAVVHEEPTAIERLVAAAALTASAAVAVGAMAWGVALVTRLLNG